MAKLQPQAVKLITEIVERYKDEPTSTMMILGLKYLDIPYKEWLKNAWKMCLTLLVIVLVVICVVVFI